MKVLKVISGLGPDTTALRDEGAEYLNRCTERN